MFKYIRVVFISVVLTGCASLSASVNSTPTPSTIRFLDTHVDLKGIQWMEHQAIENGVRLDFAGILVLNKDLAFLFGGLGVPAGDLGSVLLRTEDGGKTWSEVMNPVRGSIVQQVVFEDDGKGWALVLWTVEGPGNVILYHTTDFGRTWERLSDVPKWQWYGYPVSMKFFDESNGQIDMIYDGGLPSTNRVAFLTTSDGGLTWQETSSAPLDTYHYERASQTYESAGQDGSLWKLESGDWKASQAIISQRLTKESDWSVVSVIPKHFKYVNGHAVSP